MIHGLDALFEKLDYLADETPGGGLSRDLIEGAGEMMADEVRGLAPEDSGHLRESIQSRMEFGEAGWRSVIRSRGLEVPYDLWVNRGTGVFGPYQTPIVPTHARALKFYWRRMGVNVIARSVQGQPGQHFFERGYEEGKLKIGVIFTHELTVRLG